MDASVKRGRFITLEGGEGSGKSTQCRLLAEALTENGIPCRLSREPGGSPGAEEIRQLLVQGEPGRWDAVSETLLLFAARHDHWLRTIEPALERGEWVICDRFADSTMAYQGYAGKMDRAKIDALYDLAIGTARPDLTLILDIPVEEGLRRAVSRGGEENRFEKMEMTFHQALREGFLDIARRCPERCVVVSALGSVAVIRDRIQRVVSGRFPDVLLREKDECSDASP